MASVTRRRSQEALERALDELKNSESKLRRVIDTIPTLVWCDLADGSNEFLNKRWHEYTGLSPEESHGWGWQAAFHPEDLPPLMEKWRELLVSGEPGEIEARLCSKFFIQSQIEFKHVHPRFTKKAELPSLGVRMHELQQFIVRNPARFRHSRNLELSSGRRDVGIQTRSRGSNQINRDGVARILRLQ